MTEPIEDPRVELISRLNGTLRAVAEVMEYVGLTGQEALMERVIVITDLISVLAQEIRAHPMKVAVTADSFDLIHGDDQ